MVERTPARRAELAFLTLSALLLPTLSLLPLGGMYLWEKGWLLHWALAALGLVSFVALVQWLALRRPASSSATTGGRVDEVRPYGAEPDKESDGSRSHWSPAERAAWQDVRAVASDAGSSVVTDPDAAWQLATRTVEVVSRRLHPGSDQAMWQFTLPEALAISERVSRRLSRFVATHVPFGDRLTAAQIMSLYKARTLVDVAGRAYDVWRILRLANPATAVTHEVRERLTKALISWGHEQISRRLVETYVEEIGRAAIDLYGGRLRPAALRPAAGTPSAASHDDPPSEALPRVPLHRQIRNAAGALFRRKKTGK
ncbi:MAG TPA: GTP-binding protein HSR1 [Hyphomicrobiaceae bacterium]|nr:GTP-binding protein HSR1 [Hyphomicrobiaceae bacterium]